MRTILKSKIHRATVTDCNLSYEGSISICPELMELADIIEYEQVDILNVSNGERFTTYAISGKPGEICINGAAAWKAHINDIIIIVSYIITDYVNKPRIVKVDENNKRLE